MPPPTAQPLGRRGGGGGGGCAMGAAGLSGLKHHALMKGVSGIVMEHESHSLRLRRSRGGSSSGGVGGGATPAGMSPGGVAAASAAPASAVVAAAAGGGGRGLRQQQQQQLTVQRHFTFDFREPDQMEEFRAQRLQRKFREKLGAKCAKYELVAGFHLDEGVIVSYHPFRTRIHFELTERRRKILGRYYHRGQQEVLLYVDRSEFEYYTPVCCYQPPKSPATRDGGENSKQRNKRSSTSCFAIAGCAS